MKSHRIARRVGALGAIAVTMCAAVATASGASATAPAAAPETVTVRPDPSYQGDRFQGWGTSLAWFANATGDYPPAVRERLADLVFGEDGLNLNIARYNVGGGNAPDVPDYLRPGGAVEGWWKAPAGTTREDTDWWDADDPADWNPKADRTQRWWVDHIKRHITRWEAFSNSPPWFQTVSGYVSGGFNANADQLKTESIDDYTRYLVGAVDRLERAHRIRVDTIDPFNEPNTPYWSTRLDASGQPVAGRQEGAHMSPQLQAKVVPALTRALQGARTHADISAMDETNPGTFLTDWNAYPTDVRAQVSQLNVHTYGTGQRTAVRDIAKGEDKPLWMSEVEGSWGDGQSFTSMEPGLGMAQHMVDDLRELEPDAWVLWQPVEDYDNMKPGGESAKGANWGEIQVPFGCTSADTLQTCPVYTNTKFNTVRNFTHYIRPGDRFIGVDDTASVAALSRTGATVVHINDATTAQTVTLDLSKFGWVSRHATVTPVVSSADGALVKGRAVRVDGDAVTLTVPAQSVTTFLVQGVGGVARDAALVQPGHVYRLTGVPSAKAVAPNAARNGIVLRSTDAASADQLWRIDPLADRDTHRARYAVRTATGDRELAVANDAAVLAAPEKRPGPAAQWILSTTGDGTFTLVNVASKRVLDVGGGATNDGAPVSVWLANSGINQRFAIRDETVLGTQPAEAFTVPGTAPTLPDTVTGIYRDGPRGALPVSWRMPDSRAWRRPDTVTVYGVATDPLGGRHLARARVLVDTLTSTRPASAKTFAGGEPELPATVEAVGSRGIAVDRPVTWDAAPAGAYDEVGVVTLNGRADAGDGRTLPATVRVTVTEPVEENAARAAGTTIAATFTEPGYSTAGLNNGVLTDKAWSNWKSGAKDPSDTITVTLPSARYVSRVATHFYRDGSTDSYAQSLKVQVRDAQGAWVDASDDIAVPGGSPAPVTSAAFRPVKTDAIRVVLTARPATHITISELEVYALASAP